MNSIGLSLVNFKPHCGMHKISQEFSQVHHSISPSLPPFFFVLYPDYCLMFSSTLALIVVMMILFQALSYPVKSQYTIFFIIFIIALCQVQFHMMGCR